MRGFCFAEAPLAFYTACHQYIPNKGMAAFAVAAKKAFRNRTAFSTTAICGVWG
jgi:hypothetical protein